MLSSYPEQEARNRYSRSFQSNIFQPAEPQGPTFVPAGKRRDQTTSELFGSYDDRTHLQACPRTFVPKDDGPSARERKNNLLASEVLEGRGLQQQPSATPRGVTSEAGYVHPARPVFDPYAEDEEVDTNLRRQEELKSKLFGRATPATGPDGRPIARSSRLTPNDFSWHTHPERRGGHDDGRGGGSAEGAPMTSGDRAYQEKCSHLFDHRTPAVREAWMDTQRQMHQQELEYDQKRRNNQQYSNLFGREAPCSARSSYERSTLGCAEDRLIVHKDWTDAKTELVKDRTTRPEEPYLRKSDELHQARIFGGSGRREDWQPSERQEAMTFDNSNKVRSALGTGTQRVHQAHLRTSMRPDKFYEEAESCTEWEVRELHLSGLGLHADNNYVRDLCTGFDVQLVKVCAEVDPVRNLCKGRAKVMVRYNPRNSGVHDLVRKLEEANLRVEQ